MARKRIITPEKKELISKLIEEYNIKTAKDLQEALKDLLGDTIQNMLKAELDEHLGYEKEEWQNRPLDEVYPLVFIDAIHFSVKNDGLVTKKAVYVVLTINTEGLKDVIGIYIGENESSKFWLGVLYDLKSGEDKALCPGSQG